MAHVRGDCNRDSPHASPPAGRVCHRAGSGPDGAGPAPGLEKFRFLKFCLLRLLLQLLQLLRRGRSGARPNRVCGKALPLVFIFPDISSESPIRLQLSPTVSDCLLLFPMRFAARPARGEARKAVAGDRLEARSLGGKGGQGIRRLRQPRANGGHPRLRLAHPALPMPASFANSLY